jgi:hypothetical protein
MENMVKAFAAHDVVVVEPRDTLGQTYVAIKTAVIYKEPELLIAFPPCQYLCSSGLHWNTRRPERALLTEESLELVQFLLQTPVGKIALENPVGCISSRIRKPDQTIQPYNFGHDASKKTCLWLKNLPLLVPTNYVKPRMVEGKPRWGNQYDDGQNTQGYAAERTRVRAERWSGVCEAMAAQWTC